MANFRKEEIDGLSKKILETLRTTAYGEVGVILTVHNGNIKRIKWVNENQQLWDSDGNNQFLP